MVNDQGGRFPNWDILYRQNVKILPWYSEKLDADLENEIKQMKITKGRFLDLGTGPGTQAIQLANMDFVVNGTDLSENAIQKARKLDGTINCMVDDILDSKLEKNSFDYILDRGCFHVLPNDKWNQYCEKIHDIHDENGLFFLKWFSIKRVKLDCCP